MRRRHLLWLVAVAAGVLGVLVAPDDWPAGEGRIVVEVRGETTTELPVTVGDATPVETGGVELPGGVPLDAPVEVLVDAPGAALGDVEVTLVLPDGTEELVPTLRVDGEVVVSSRTPPRRTDVVLGLLGVVVVLWVSELVPLHVAGLTIPVVLVVGDVATARDALSPFFDPIIVLFFGGFLMAEAIRRVGLDRLAAARIVSVAGGRPVALFAAFCGVSAFLSMWMSNTAAVAVMLPIALAVTAPVADEGFRRAVVLGLAYAATVGGVGSAIGTPANPLAITFLDDVVGTRISFAEWFAYGLPVVFLLLPVVGWWVWTRSRVRIPAAEMAAVRAAAGAEREAAGRLTRPQVEVLAVLGLVVAGWLTQTWHDVNPGIVALAGAIVMMVIGRIETDDLQRISWPTLLTFGGGLAFGTALVATGTSDWVVTRLTGLADLPEMLALLGVATVTLALTTVASNTASAATLIPMAIPLAGVIGVDPTLLVVLVAVASSIDFALVIGTPPTMLAYGTGLFTARRIFSVGIVLDLVGILILTLVVTRLWAWLGLVS